MCVRVFTSIVVIFHLWEQLSLPVNRSILNMRTAITITTTIIIILNIVRHCAVVVKTTWSSTRTVHQTTSLPLLLYSSSATVQCVKYKRSAGIEPVQYFHLAPLSYDSSLCAPRKDIFGRSASRWAVVHTLFTIIIIAEIPTAEWMTGNCNILLQPTTTFGLALIWLFQHRNRPAPKRSPHFIFFDFVRSRPGPLSRHACHPLIAN